MRKYIYTILICAAMFCTPTTSAERIVLNNNNINKITTANSCFVVEDRITLPAMALTVGENSVIQFRGGSFRGGKLNINGAMVDAAPYYIFEGTEIEGLFGNEEVQVKWFTPSVYGYADQLNRALDMAAENQVVLSGALNYVNGTFVLNKPGQRFRANGRVSRNDSADPLFELSAPDLDLYVRKITRYDSLFHDNKVVHLYGDVENSRIDINDMSGGNRGLAFTPSGTYPNGMSQRVRNNKIRFAHINSKADPIYFNAVNSTAAGYKLTVGGNFFLGGRLSGDSGVRQIYAGGQTYPYYGNVYCGLIFESIKSVCLQMSGSENEIFVYTRMNEEFPAAGNPYLDITDSRYSRIYTKGVTNAGKEIYAGKNVNNVDIEVYTNTGELYSHTGFSRAIVTSPTADATGPASVFLTSSEIPYNNRMTTLDFAASSVSTNTATVQIDDLFAIPAPMVQTSRFFNDFTVINIGANRKVQLSHRDGKWPIEFKTVLLPMTLMLNLDSNATFIFNGTQVDKSGTYRFVWQPGWTAILEKCY